MKPSLAERLLIRVMEWTDEEATKERRLLQAMATYKYDEYQQFSPGMRFTESLACWLNQFETKEEKQVAYSFIKERIVFISFAEMNHLVEMSYPYIIRPILYEKVASFKGIPKYKVKQIAESKEYNILKRS